MQPPSIPLALAAAAFLAVLVWRVRPAFTQPWQRRKASRDALREANARVEGAADEPSRARALCDAAEQMAQKVGGTSGAASLYLRAMRSDPRSRDVLERTVAGLGKRPRRLESLLWRYLAAAPWSAPISTDEAHERARVREVLDALRVLYEGPLKNQVRARALANVRDALS